MLILIVSGYLPSVTRVILFYFHNVKETTQSSKITDSKIREEPLKTLTLLRYALF